MNRKSQRGYVSLIGMLIALAIASAIIALIARQADRKYREDYGSIEGQSLAQFAIGLRGFASAVQGTPTKLPTNPYIVAGVNWLKPPACGGLPGNPVEGYVPCSYSGQTLGPKYQTTINYTPGTGAIEARTTFVVPPISGDAGNRLLIAERMAKAALVQQPMGTTYFAAFANTTTAATAPASPNVLPAPADRGRVLLVVNSSPGSDLWLRTDGTNKMLAALNMGGQSLMNAKDGQFAGDVRVKGATQFDGGMTVTNGTADFRQGVIAKDMVLDSIGKRASQAFYDATVLTGGASYIVSKPDCSATPNNQPSIYTSIQSTGSPVGQDALYSATVKADDLGTTWRVTPIMYGTNFTLSADDANIYLNKASAALNPSDMTIVVMTQCR